MNLKEQVIIVTGACSGIGKASAFLFAAEGASVMLTSIDPKELIKVEDEINSKGGHALALETDVTDFPSCKRVIEKCEKHFGHIDGLFNNAGAFYKGDSGLLDTPLDVWEKTIAVNLTGVFNMSKATVPAMLRTGQGAILNNASMVAHIGSATAQIAYCAAKGGVVSMTREMAIELAPKNIRVNAISPGPIRTDLFEELLKSDPDFLRNRLPHMPLKRFGEISEIAQFACFLLSDASSYLVGQTIVVDGGITVAYTTDKA